MKLTIDPAAPWYHGSNARMDILRSGSTITQWRQLAEAFSHKPTMLCTEDDGSIVHNGVAPGILYIIAEEIAVGTDIIPHPRTTMDENAEWITNRPLRLRIAG